MAEVQKDILIVYGVYINPQVHWQGLITQQLHDLQQSGILSRAELHVVISNPSQTEGVQNFFAALPIAIAHLEMHQENKFEYWAIDYLWKIAQATQKFQYVSYFHTKSMSYYTDTRDRVEKLLSYFLFDDWKRTISIFKKNAKINKIGLFPAIDPVKADWGGWIWFNFWWARIEYIQKLEQPIDSTDRYYYEHWLSLNQQDKTLNDCFSLVSNKNTLFTTDDIPQNFRIPRMRYKLRFWLKLIRKIFVVWR